MGVIIRQSALATFFTYIGVAIGYVNLLILFPKYMSPDEVGLARIIQDAAMLMVPFAQLGVAQLVLRYYPEYKGKKKYSDFVSSVFLLMLIALIFFSLLFFLLKEQIGYYFISQSPEVVNYIGVMLLLIWIMSVHQILVSFSNSSLNIVLPNFLKEVWLRALTLSGIILFATSTISFDQFITFLVSSYAINLVILLLYLFASKVLIFKLSSLKISSDEIRPMIKYGLITFLGASGILIIGKVDSLMVTGMLGLTENAIYTTAFYIAVLIELPKRAVAQISTPIISRAFESNKLDEVADIYRKSALNNLIIGFLIFIGLWVNLESLYSLIPRSEVYSLGYYVVLIVGAGKLLDMAAGVNGEIIVMSKYYKVNVYLIIILAIITIIANYFLIPLVGITGAAIGSAIALFIFNASKYLFLYYKMSIQPFSKATVVTIIIGIFVLFIGMIMPKLTNVYLDIIYRSVIVAGLYTLTIILLKVSPEINEQVSKLIGRRK